MSMKVKNKSLIKFDLEQVTRDLEGTDYGADIDSQLPNSNVKTLDRTYEPDYEEILPSERQSLPTLVPTTMVSFIRPEGC